MSKAASLTALVARKGTAMPPADAQGRVLEPAAQLPAKPAQLDLVPPPPPKAPKPARAPRAAAPAPVAPAAARTRPWDGQDQPIRVNYAVPERVKMKLHAMKAAKAIGTVEAFVAKAIEEAIDKVIAQYDTDMGTLL